MRPLGGDTRRVDYSSLTCLEVWIVSRCPYEDNFLAVPFYNFSTNTLVVVPFP